MLSGKTAVVTGASRGIGRAIAEKLAAEGAFVVINYNGSKARADETAEEIRSFGGQAETYQCDVSDFNQAAGLMEYRILRRVKRG